MADMGDPSQGKTLWETSSLLFPGFAGSIVSAIYFTRPASRTEVVSGILAGTVTSVFLAPVIAHLVAPNIPNAYSGIGFLVGVLTVTLVPVTISQTRKLIEQINWDLLKSWISRKKT
jgi:hypothetical protein